MPDGNHRGADFAGRNDTMIPAVFILMGVSGAGKTTVGKALARTLGIQFFDGDDYHPLENVVKMSQGTPLTDDDRRPWLAALHRLIRTRLSSGQSAVIACSALKKSYRQQLLDDNIGALFIYLKCSFELIERRLLERSDHYMKADLLASQFLDLEEPTRAIVVDASLQPSVLVDIIKKQICLDRS